MLKVIQLRTRLKNYRVLSSIIEYYRVKKIITIGDHVFILENKREQQQSIIHP